MRVRILFKTTLTLVLTGAITALVLTVGCKDNNLEDRGNKMSELNQTKIQLLNIFLGLQAFRNEFGDYPPSDNDDGDYCGAQKLAEALVGYDLYGYHPKSKFKSDGTWDAGQDGRYDKDDVINVRERKGSYVDLKDDRMFTYTDVENKESSIKLTKANAVLLKNIFVNTGLLNGETYVLCDVFAKKNPVYGGKVGMPILYFRADHSSLSKAKANRTYDFKDNEALIDCGVPWDNLKAHELDSKRFYSFEYVGERRQVLPSQFLLISAGPDGLYGTDDDIIWRSNQQFKVEKGEVVIPPR